MGANTRVFFVYLYLLLGLTLPIAWAENNGTVPESEGTALLALEPNTELPDNSIEENNTLSIEEPYLYLPIEEVTSLIRDVGENLTEDNESITNTLLNESVTLEANISLGVEYESLANESESQEITQDAPEKITKSLVKQGKIEIEYSDYENSTLEIVKKERLEGEGEKIVRISSEEHFDDELKVYSDLPREAEQKDIIIFWENEEEEVSSSDISYFDADENGLIERVSWIVPHLSVQTYRIIINFTVQETNSSEIILSLVSGPSNGANVSNPVQFIFNASYSNASLLNCGLYLINETESTLLLIVNLNSSDNLDLSEGRYNWTLRCEDNSTAQVRNLSGYFNVVDRFRLSLDDFYFLAQGIVASVDANGGVVELSWVNGVQRTFFRNISNFPEAVSLKDGGTVINRHGSYTLEATSRYFSPAPVLQKTISVAETSVTFNSSITLGSEATFNVTILSPRNGFYSLRFGNQVIRNFTFNSAGVSERVSYTPTSAGNYDVILDTTIAGKQYSYNAGRLEVRDNRDTRDPEITLYEPAWEEEVDNSSITFRYKVEDNVHVLNCSLEIYNATQDSSNNYQTDKLIFPLTSSDRTIARETNLGKGRTVNLTLVDFDEGNYIWEVKCYDNSSNEGWDFNYFEVRLNGNSNLSKQGKAASYSREEEVESLLKTINDFLDKKSTLGSEELLALDLLGLGEDMNLFKKQLLQYDQDIKYNLRFMEETKREERIKEIYSEIDDIRKSIISGIKVEDTSEFTKNSLSQDIEEIIKTYFEGKGINLKSSSLRALVSFNTALQNKMSVKTHAMKLSLSTLEGTKEKVLVNKEIDVDSKVKGDILESFPGDWKGEPAFITKHDKVSEDLYVVQRKDLKDNSLTYYIDGSGVELEDLEETETLLFQEDGASEGGVGMTGMFTWVGDSVSSFSLLYLFVAGALGYVGVILFQRIRLEMWKREEPGVLKMLDLLGQAKRSIRLNEIDNARDNYEEMKEIYKALPAKCKTFFYNEIKNVRLGIDRKDVMNLVKEYEKAKDDYRKEDAALLHARINDIYKKLPKRYQEKVYQRLVKKEV